MTAICGWVDGASQATLRERVGRSLKALSRYGSGSPSILSHDLAVFGIDLHASLPEDVYDRQPLEFGADLLVADLRIDNRRDLARALIIPPSELKLMPDSALLARAWRRWGSEALVHVIGDFALAVHSRATRTTWLARSLGGNRPLFYSQANGSLAFATMASGILSEASFRRGFSLDRIAAGLTEDFGDSGQSYFQGIHRILPGQLVVLSPGGVTKEEIWQPNFEKTRFGDQGSFIEAYRSVLDTAVNCRLRRAGGRVASQLSAGYDSSAVTTTAARLIEVKSNLLALTAAPREGYAGPTYRGRTADESPFASLTARSCGSENLVVRSVENVKKLFRSQAATHQDPFRNVLNSAWDVELRREARKRGASVILTGELGNLTLNAGGIDSLSDLLLRGAWPHWFRQALAAHPAYPWSSIALNSVRPWLSPALVRLAKERLRGQNTIEKTYFLRQNWLRRLPLPAHSPGREKQSTNERRFAGIRRFDSGTVRKGSLAETGTDTRDPLIDRRIIDFSVSLPSCQLFDNGMSTPLARAALVDRVPKQILQSRIRGYQAADWHLWFTSEQARSMAEEISESPTARELIDFDRLEAAINSWPSGKDLTSAAVIQRYTGILPMTLAAGMFFCHFERNDLV